MKLEVGKYYRTRDGRKVGPIYSISPGSNWVRMGNHEPLYPANDLIAEWQDEPVVEADGFLTVSFDEITANHYGVAHGRKISPGCANPYHVEPTTRARILDTAKQAVTKDRQAAHGKPEDTFGLIAAYWSAHLDTAVTAADVATMMALLKLARSKSNPAYQDNWIDLAGYAACAGELADAG